MQRKMLFKIGVTLVLGIGIILFYLVNIQNLENESAIKATLLDEKEKLHIDLKKNVVHVAMEKTLKDFVIAQKLIDIEMAKERIKDENSSYAQTADGILLFEQSSKEDKLHYDNVEDKETPQIKSKTKQLLEPATDEIQSKNILLFNEKHLHPVYDGQRHHPSTSSVIHLSVVVCGERQEETMVMLKSAALVTPISQSLTFHIVAETISQKFFQDQLENWPLVHRQRLAYNIYNISFPNEAVSDSWKVLFKPCASQRLFLPELLQSVDSLIYVDTDTLFLRSLSDLWAHFSEMNQTQLAGVVSEAEDGTNDWYNRFASHPFYGQYGINSGVMLMNLTRLRQTSWLADMQTLYKKYKMMIPWGDQDLINIYFAAHPDQVYLMSCPWNYRNDHCKYTHNCRAAEVDGIFVLHGSRRIFYQNKEPSFAAIFETFKAYQLGEPVGKKLLKVVETRLLNATSTNCGKVSHLFLKQLIKLLNGYDNMVVTEEQNSESTPDKKMKADIRDDTESLKEGIFGLQNVNSNNKKDEVVVKDSK